MSVLTEISGEQSRCHVGFVGKDESFPKARPGKEVSFRYEGDLTQEDSTYQNIKSMAGGCWISACDGLEVISDYDSTGDGS